MALTPKKFDDIRLREETIRNMQRKKAPKKPQLKNPAGGVKKRPSGKTPQLSSQTKRPMNPLVIKDRKNKLKKPKLKDETRAPMSTEAIKNRKSKLKKPKLKDETRTPMSKEAINNRKNKLKKPKLKDETLAPMSTEVIKNRKSKLKKPKLKDETKTPMSTEVIKNRKSKLKKPKLKDKTKTPMSTEVIKNRKSKLKKPKLKDKTKTPMSTAAIKGRKSKLKKPKLKDVTKTPMSTAAIKGRKSKLKKPALDSKTLLKAAAKSTQKYPVGGFLFKVQVKGFQSETSFKEVSGISVEREVEIIEEGGNNDFAYRVPKGPPKYSNLVLKRGLMSTTSPLATWCFQMLQSTLATKIEAKTIHVELQDTYDGSKVMKWSFMRAWPIKWEVSGFDSQKSEIVIESIEFAYNYFKVT